MYYTENQVRVNIMPTSSSLVALEFVVLPTYGATNDDKVGIITTLSRTSSATRDDRVGIVTTLSFQCVNSTAMTICRTYQWLVQGCSVSIALAVEVLQSCTKPSIYSFLHLQQTPHISPLWVDYGGVFHEYFKENWQCFNENKLYYWGEIPKR